MSIKKTITIDADTKNAQKNVQKLGDTVNNEAKDMKGSLSGVNDSLDSFSGGLISKFKGLKGTLGGVAGGFKSIGVAIAASGIGLLVLTIAAVTAAFKSSEEGQNKFAKIMGVIGSVTGNLIDLLSDFGEMVIEAFENPQQTFENFKKSIRENIETRLEGLLNLIPSIGKAFKQLWEGDFKAAGKTATDSLGKIVLGVESVTDSFSKAIDKVKEFGAELERDAKRAAQIADMRAAADKKERELLVKRAKADRAVAEFREKAAQKDIFSAEQRIEFLEKASKIEQDITAREIEASILKRDAKIAENALAKSTKEDLDEEAQLTAKVIELETKSLKLKKALTAEIVTARKEEQALRDAELAEKEAQIEKEAEIERKRQESIQSIREEYKNKLEDLRAEDEQAKYDLEEQRKLQELEVLNATEQEKLEVRRYYDQLQTDLEKEQADERVAIAMAEKEAKAGIFNAQADILVQFGQFLQQMGEKNKALAIAGIVAEQVGSVAKIISNTGVANAKAIAATPLTAGQPFVALNTVSAGLSIASSVASAAKAIGQLGGGGGGLQRESPTAGATAQPQAPSFNLIGQGGINQVAQSLNQRNNSPIQAYVVSKQVDTQSELDRNRKQNASFG